jgi:hypothetical protein
MNRDEIQAALGRHAAGMRGSKRRTPIAPTEREEGTKPGNHPLVTLLMVVLMGVLILAVLAWAAWQ